MNNQKNPLMAILTRLIQIKTRTKRELEIAFTVIAGMLFSYFLFKNDNQFSHDVTYIINSFNYHDLTIYYTHLTINFLKSFVMVLLCSFVAIKTESIRILLLTIIVALSMSMDLVSIFSTDAYYIIKPYRYLNNYNFKDFYSAFEVACVLYSFIDITLNPIKPFFKNYFSGCDVIRHSVGRKSIFTYKK